MSFFLHHYNHLVNWKLLSPLCKWEHQRFREVRYAYIVSSGSEVPTQAPWFLSPCSLQNMLTGSLQITYLPGFYAIESWVFPPSDYNLLKTEGKWLYHWEPQGRVGWHRKTSLAWLFTAGGQNGRARGKNTARGREGLVPPLSGLLSWLPNGCISYLSRVIDHPKI